MHNRYLVFATGSPIWRHHPTGAERPSGLGEERCQYFAKAHRCGTGLWDSWNIIISIYLLYKWVIYIYIWWYYIYIYMYGWNRWDKTLSVLVKFDMRQWETYGVLIHGRVGVVWVVWIGHQFWMFWVSGKDSRHMVGLWIIYGVRPWSGGDIWENDPHWCLIFGTYQDPRWIVW